MYLKTKDKWYWKELIRWLPESWLQTRTITISYENILNMIQQRKDHKLSEWHYVIDEFRKLPYAKELLFLNEEE
jgi:phenolic acid decarboxylase